MSERRYMVTSERAVEGDSQRRGRFYRDVKVVTVSGKTMCRWMNVEVTEDPESGPHAAAMKQADATCRELNGEGVVK